MSVAAGSTTVTTSHVGINVRDLERSIAFYTTVFGFEVGRLSSDPSKRYAFLTSAGQLVVTLWEQSAAAFDPARAGLHHLALAVADTESFAAAERAVRQSGVKVYYDGVVAQGENVGALFFEDPDGTHLEIVAPYRDAPPPPGDGPACGFF